MGRLGWALRDGWTLTRRELGHLRAEPGQLIGAVVFPCLLVLLFGYVFGSAISVPGGGGYREFLMPGLFAMTAVTGLGVSALRISRDVAEGVMDRFRTMPVSRLAVPFGRTAADLLSGALGVAIMAAVGLLVGWRAHHGLLPTAAAFGLILLLMYAVSWVSVSLGLMVSPATADGLIPIVFPISMLSNSFVPTAGMPAWLRTVTEWNPISALVAACRDLFGNPGAAAAHTAWPLAHPELAIVGWALLLIVVFAPLATWRYRTAGR
jgi:ABC-2 type transport system permease protein